MEDEPPEDNKLEVMRQLLCMACLCTGPALNNPDNSALRQYYLNILSEIQVTNDVPYLTIKVCWDCNALLNKSVQFRQQVKESFEKLHSSLQTLGDVEDIHSVLTSKLGCPPRLQKCSSHSIHIESFITDEHGAEERIQIKEEIQDEVPMESNASPQLLCMACLSTGQTLKSIMHNTLNKYFMDILKETQVKDNIDAVTPIVCCQCEGLLRTIVRFRDQVKSSYEVLYPSFEMHKEGNSVLFSGVNRLPRLQVFARDAVDIQPLSQDPPSIAEGLILPDQPMLIKQETIEVEIDYTPDTDSTGSHQCSLCPKKYDSSRSLNQHMRIHNRGQPIPCPQCEQVFTRLYAFKAHYKLHKRDENECHQCNICSEIFRKKSALNTHKMTLHKDARPFNCSVCPKTFRHSGSLKIHMVKHETDKAYHCTDCSKSFHMKNNLKQHMRTHTGERPFKCSQCKEAFRFKPQLILHMAVHTGDEPYACSQCTKKFSQSGKLKEHMRSHTGENQYPHQCNHCSKAFRHNYSLNVHMRLHTGERPFQCNECMKSFTRRVNILKHLKVHSGLKDYPCKKCTKSYTKKYYLLKHLEEKHPKKDLKKHLEDKHSEQNINEHLEENRSEMDIKEHLEENHPEMNLNKHVKEEHPEIFLIEHVKEEHPEMNLNIRVKEEHPEMS